MKLSRIMVLCLAIIAIITPAVTAEAEGLRIGGVVGETISIPVEITDFFQEDFDLVLPSLPPGVQIGDTPTVFARFGVAQRIQLEAIVTRAGRFVIPPIQLVAGSQITETQEILLEVAPSRGAPVPFGLRWRPVSDTVFVGQSVPVLLEITGIDSLTFPDTVTVRAPQGGLFEEVTGLGSVQTERVAGVQLYTIPVAAFLFTPTLVGETSLPSAQVVSSGLTVTAPALEIPARELPPGVIESGAVGQFTITTDPLPDSIAPGEVIEFSITVRGVGNITVLDPPTVSAEGFEIVESDETILVETDTETLWGYSGSRTQHFRLQQVGDVSADEYARITVGAFTYIDPNGEILRRIPGQEFRVAVLAEGTGEDGEQTVPDIRLIPINRLSRFRWFPLHTRRGAWTLYIVAPLAFGAFSIWRVRRNPAYSRRKVGFLGIGMILFFSFSLHPTLDMARLSRAAELVEEGNYAVAGALYHLELQNHPNHGGLHFNRGVLALRSGDEVSMRFHLRRALRLDAENQYFRTALSESEGYFGSSESFPIPWYPRGDFFFIALLIVWSSLWGVFLLKSSTSRSLVIISLIMVAFVALSGAVWRLNVARIPEGVIRQDVTVRRIPDASAEQWLALPPGVPVLVDLSYADFYLIRTVAGVTGWVPIRAVWYEGAIP